MGRTEPQCLYKGALYLPYPHARWGMTMKRICEVCIDQLCTGMKYGLVRVESDQTFQDAAETFRLMAARGNTFTPAEPSCFELSPTGFCRIKSHTFRFRQSVEICAVLGHYAACGCNSIPTFRDGQSAPYSRVKNSRMLQYIILSTSVLISSYTYTFFFHCRMVAYCIIVT